MGEDVLTDALLSDFSKEFSVSEYPPRELSTHLNLGAVAGDNARYTANIESNPQQAYFILLRQFVEVNGRGMESVRKLINIFKENEKGRLANDLEKAVKKASMETEDSHQEPTLPDGERDKKLVWIAGLIFSVVAAILIFAYRSEYITETLTVQECQQLLREYYEVHLFKIPIKPWDPDDFVDLEDYFTTVSLYKEDKNNIADKSLQKITLNGSVNDIFQTKIRRSLPKRIVLFGEAGRGKTTAVAKMAYDWATKKKDSPLKDVKLLFVFKMRNMNEQTGIAEAVIQLLGKKFRKYETNLEEYIDSHEKDIVILFDGYDEFTGGLQSSGNTSDIIDILRNDRCKQCRVLVTSRPTKRTDFNYIYSKMVIEGYSQQHTTGFIDKFFLSRKTKGIELKNYLKEDIVANEMIATPLFCTMVCHLWNEGYNHGIFTRTKLFDGIMHFLRTHLNAKDEGNEKIGESLVIDTVISVGKVAFKKLNNTEDLNPLLFREDDFSEIHTEKVNISFSLGLLTKSVNTDRDFDIYIEFFHKLAQEYSAGRYLATSLDEGRLSTIGFSEIAFDMKEVLQFASGTSDSACLKIVASIVDRGSPFEFIHEDYLYHSMILDFLSETETCAERSKTHLTRFLEDGKLHLQVTASTVVGLEILPGSVKEKITTIDINGTDSSPALFTRLWNNMHTCFNLIHIQMKWHVPPPISPEMKKLYSVNSFTTAIQPNADDSVRIVNYLPNLIELVIDCDKILRDDDYTSNIFRRVWNQLDSTPSLSRLTLPIPANIASNLKHLSSVHVLETNNGIYQRSLAHVLTFLPHIRELIVNWEPLAYIDYLVEKYKKSSDFCELWEKLHTLPELNRLLLPLPLVMHERCELRPLLSVQVFETKSSTPEFYYIFRQLPNLHKLILYSNHLIHGFPDLPGLPDTDPKWFCIDRFFKELGKIYHDHNEFQHLKVTIPPEVPVLPTEPLQTLKIFQTALNSNQMKVFSKLLSLLPNITELDIIVREMPKNDYWDRVVSVIVDGLVKNNIQLEVLNMSISVPKKYFREDTNNTLNTVSHDTVQSFIQMLKSSGRLKQLRITNFYYCVFSESDLIEIVTAIRTSTSVVMLSLEFVLSSEGELFQYAMRSNQSTEQNPKLNVDSRQRRSLKLTLSFWDKKNEITLEKNFVLPPLD